MLGAASGTPGVSEKMASAGVHEDATVVASPSAQNLPPVTAIPPPSVSPKTTEGGGSTVIFSMPKLVAIQNGAPAEEYVLNAKTSIGRTSKNDIQVLEDSVSRSHCEVILAADGYKVMDLGSHNGISVNGEKVTERLLADGDILQIGTRQFLFRA
jgi:pSer/pThr/pTyr-binding forkhead associated (FHA) protein